MRYFTFAQEIEDESAKKMVSYLRERKIKFEMGADFSFELQPFGYLIDREKALEGSGSTLAGLERAYLVNTFVILGTEEDLTAIKMYFGNITPLKNRRVLQIKNFFRKIFFI